MDKSTRIQGKKEATSDNLKSRPKTKYQPI